MKHCEPLLGPQDCFQCKKSWQESPGLGELIQRAAAALKREQPFPEIIMSSSALATQHLCGHVLGISQP